jgi:hypothetical protein
MFRIHPSPSGLPELEFYDDSCGVWRHIATFFLGDSHHYAEKILDLLQPPVASNLKMF